MTYKKITADKIFTNSNFFTNYVLVVDEKGIVIDLVPEENAGDGITRYDGIISPGFINAHCHLELSHMQGVIPMHTGLPEFVINVMKQRFFNQEKIQSAIECAEKEMVENGIVAVGDICNTADTVERKRSGTLHYHNFIEAAGFAPSNAIAMWERAKKIAEQFSNLNFQFSITPHAPYSVSRELFHLINESSKGKIASIHNQECDAENDFFETGEGLMNKVYQFLKTDLSFYKPYNKNSLQTYLPWMSAAEKLILVHNTVSNCNDIIFAQQHATSNKQELFWCICINANLYIENKLPPLELLREHNAYIVLGTDSLASNHTLSILDEIKIIRKNFPKIPLEEILQWATLNGAKALNLQNQLGSFEKGKTPGILVLDNGLKSIKRLV